MILIVDDSVIIIERLLDMLSEFESKSSIKHVSSLGDAIAFLQHTTPHIVLLDINLTDGNGVELLRLIKKKYPSIIVIMLTNQSDEYYRKLCTKLGASHFLDKSKDFEKVADIIATLKK